MKMKYNVILWLFIPQAICFKWTMYAKSLDSYTYSGSTPYQNDTFYNMDISNALRTQRDIATNITIDQLIWPALDMSTAFFGKTITIQRLSEVNNILTMGYKRLVLDLYWNSTASNWQLCSLDAMHCDADIYFIDFLNVIDEFFIATGLDSSPTKTDLVFLVLNLHELNQTNNATVKDANLGQVIQQTLASKIYTPANLTVDRINVSASFLSDGRESYFPVDAYQKSTIWPNWLYLIEKSVQLIVGYGSIPSNATSFQLTTNDNNTIFNTQDIGGIMNMTESVCPSRQSWGYVNDFQTPFTYATALNTTKCNYSPYFTQSNYSTSTSIYSPIDSGHLADNILSTIWSWDVNEPKPDNNYRCAAFQKWNARWKATDCELQYRAACRSANDPSVWRLTDDKYNYDRSLTACPENYIFDVPRIPYQNVLLNNLIQQENVLEDHVWINLNLAYTEAQCWVVGRYGSCWWLVTTGQEFLGLIQTSIVSGLIILILVGIFAWVKCTRLWRTRNSKERKTMVKAMVKKREYVTLPA